MAMATKHLVDTELLSLLDEFPTLSLSQAGLAGIRAERAALLAEQLPLQPAFPDIEVSERSASGPDGAPDVRVLVYLPKTVQRPLPALVWIHGGGYVLGSADADDLLVKTMVSEVGCAALSVDYRLAPESPFPAGVEDCYAVLKWAHAQAATLGLNRQLIAIGGSSAGGGLAAALALLARDRAEVRAAFQMLLVPMLDDRTVTMPDPHPWTGEFVWTPGNNHFGWSSLLGLAPGSEGISPYAAPARAQSLAYLPPTYISSGALDLFLEEDMEYARRLMRAGVPTELHIYPGAFHGFSRAASAHVAQAFTRDYLSALRRALDPGAVREAALAS